jgi:hypothetical protein
MKFLNKLAFAALLLIPASADSQYLSPGPGSSLGTSISCSPSLATSGNGIAPATQAKRVVTNENINYSPSATPITILNVSSGGPGCVEEVLIAFFTTNANTMLDALFQVSIDGEGSPSVSTDLAGLGASSLAGTTGNGKWSVGHLSYERTTSGSIFGINVLFKYPIPFHSSISITLTVPAAESAGVDLWTNATYRLGVSVPWKLKSTNSTITSALNTTGTLSPGRIMSDCAITGGTTSLTCTNGNFSNTDVGRFITLLGGGDGSGGINTYTYLSAVGSGSTATVHTAPVNTITATGGTTCNAVLTNKFANTTGTADGAITGGGTTFTSASASFVTTPISDVGSMIAIAGAGAGGGTYYGKITAVQSGTSVAVSPAVTTTVSGANYSYGKDFQSSGYNQLLNVSGSGLLAYSNMSIVGVGTSYGSSTIAADLTFNENNIVAYIDQATSGQVPYLFGYGPSGNAPQYDTSGKEEWFGSGFYFGSTPSNPWQQNSWMMVSTLNVGTVSYQVVSRDFLESDGGIPFNSSVLVREERGPRTQPGQSCTTAYYAWTTLYYAPN